MASRSTINANNYEQQDEEAGEGYAMLPNASSHAPGYSPLSGAAANSRKQWGKKSKALVFVGLSFVFGFIIHVAYTLATNFTSNSAKIPPYPSNGDLVHDSESGHLSSDPMAVVAGHSKYKSKEQVKELVDSSKGYFVRDYSVWLGWNNVRYIIETTLLHAQILNRTAVLPSYVYARACEFDQATCGAFAVQVNRGKAIGTGQWDDLPESEQQGWKIPLGAMIDLDHLSHTYKNFITLDDYFDVEGLPADIIAMNGQWQQYYNKDNSYHVIENDDWDPKEIVRVDRVGEPPISDPQAVPEGLTPAKMEEMFGEESVQDLSYLRIVLQSRGFKMPDDPAGAFAALGYRLMYTYDKVGGMDFLKSPINPIARVAKESSLRGLYEDGHDEEAKIFHVQGEIHLYRPPGSVHFTSKGARNDFKKIILQDMRPLPRLYQLAAIIDERMREKNDGRAWTAAHLRRGDFESQGWAMEANFNDHLDRIKDHLNSGIQMINKNPKYLHKISGSNDSPKMPQQGDYFYIGTDERNATNLEYVRSQGGVLLSDIVTPTDRDELGPIALYTDVLSLLEQLIMANSAYFYGFALSSVAGGVVNLRTAEKYNPKTALIDSF
ncbi:hypothetical protein E3P86_02327 [Wallemia ichthyophaga]|uniref:Uncharacterized protein n=1 Tax=Wallemia ichthyophaga TaxID=245174 RepID=A0A4T0J3I4_WALIC|nr:hypothetical protein E3P86_02327 [Wallemia ichthyophaga]